MNVNQTMLLCIFSIFSLLYQINAFVVPVQPNIIHHHASSYQATTLHSSKNKDSNEGVAAINVSSTRREAFRKIISSSFLVIGGAGMTLYPTQDDIAIAAEEKESIIWKSGKSPQIPGKKPKDKNDTSGTRKDSDFLRAISNCKSQCEQSVGPDGYARSKEECLSDCQDICCKTYEQCTFGIVPRI